MQIDPMVFWTAVGSIALIAGTLFPFVRAWHRNRKEAAELKIEQAKESGRKEVIAEEKRKAEEKEWQLFQEQTQTLLTSSEAMKRELKADMADIKDGQDKLNGQLLESVKDRAEIWKTIQRHEQIITEDRHAHANEMQRIETKLDAHHDGVVKWQHEQDERLDRIETGVQNGRKGEDIGDQ